MVSKCKRYLLLHRYHCRTGPSCKCAAKGNLQTATITLLIFVMDLNISRMRNTGVADAGKMCQCDRLHEYSQVRAGLATCKCTIRQQRHTDPPSHQDGVWGLNARWAFFLVKQEMVHGAFAVRIGDVRARNLAPRDRGSNDPYVKLDFAGFRQHKTKFLKKSEPACCTHFLQDV